MPLEPRIMYDGAAAATAAHHHHHEQGGGSPDAAQAGPHGPIGTLTPSGDDGHWHPNTAPAEPMPTVTTWVKNPTEIVFIDTQAPDYQLLATGVKPGIEVVELNPNSDGVQQIANFLSRHPDPNLTTIDIVAHGQDGMLFLGNAVLDNATVGQYTAQLQTIGAALQPGGNLMLYGCDVAADPSGFGFLDQLALDTGVSVAAATGPVGSAAEGGTWTLTATTGSIDATAPFTAATLAAYPDLLNAQLTDVFSLINDGITGDAGVIYGTDSTNGSTNALSGSKTTDTESSLNTLGVPAEVQLDTQDGLIFVLLQSDDSTHPAEILEGSLQTVLSGGTPTWTTIYRAGNVNDQINAMQIDVPDNVIYLSYAVNNFGGNGFGSLYSDEFEAVTFGGAHFTGAHAPTVIGNESQQDYSAMVVDPVHKKVYFAETSNFGTTSLSQNQLAVGTWTGTLSNPAANSLSVTQLPISPADNTLGSNNFPTSDGEIGALALDTTTQVLYFTTDSIAGGASGIYSYNLNGNSTGNYTEIYAQTQSAVPGAFQKDSGGDFVIDPATNTYFVSVLDGTTTNDNAIYAGSLSGGAPTKIIAVNTPGNSGQLQPLGLAIDNAPVVTASTHATPTADQNGAAVIIDSGITVTDSDNTELSTLSSPAAATVQITGNFESGDELTIGGTTSGTFDNGAISYSFSGSTLKLTGSDTVGEFQTALEHVQFETSSGASASPRTITFTASDGLLTGTATDQVNVALPPVVVNETNLVLTSGTATGTMGTSGTGALAGDSDPGGLALDVSAVNGLAVGLSGSTFVGTYGTLTIQQDGAYSYVANASDPVTGSHPVDTFNDTVSDSSGASAAATLTFTIDRPPAQATHTASVLQDATTGTVAAGDSDPDGDALSVTQVSSSQGIVTPGVPLQGTYGTLTLNANDTYSYVANNDVAIDGAPTGSHPTDTFNYVVSDGHGGTTAETLVFTIDRPPTPANVTDTINVAGITSFSAANGVLANDIDPDGDSLTVTGVSSSQGIATPGNALQGTYGALTLNADGGFSYNLTSPPSTSAQDVFTYTVSDGHGGAASATLTLDIVPGPTITAGAAQPSFVGGGAAVTLDSGLTVSDPAHANLVGATATITGGLQSGDVLSFNNGSNTETFADNSTITATYSAGVLSLTGTASVSDYQTALDQVQFSFAPTNGDPTAGGGDTSRSISFVANDGTLASSPASLTLSVVHAAPSITAGSSASVVEGGPAATLDAGLVLSDPDSSGKLSSATVAVAGGVFNTDGDTLAAITAGTSITATYNAATETLSLSGVDTVADYQSVLQSVTFASTGPAAGSRTIDWSVNDGSSTNGSSAVATSSVTVHTYPVVTAGATATFSGGGAAVALDPGLTVTDASTSVLAGATVQIGTGFTSGDTLNFFGQNGIIGSYNSSTGVLTLSGTTSVGDYQAALDSVTYSFSPANGDPTAGGADTSRTISWVVTDGTLSSTAVSSTLDTVHTPPTVTAGATATFTGGGNAVALDSTLAVSDPDSGGNLTGATVSIGSNFTIGDTLNFSNQGGITGSYNSSTGVLTLSGTASVNTYQAAIESITYSFNPSFGDPTGGGGATSRTIDYQVSDSVAGSTAATSTLNVVHAAPTLNTGGTVTFIQGQPAVAADSTVSLSDPDSHGLLTGATVQITSGLLNGDTLSAVTTGLPSITASYDSATGVLTLSGTDTLADYRAVLGSVTFTSTSADPTGNGTDASRTLTWTINDGVSTATGTSSIDVHAVPVVTAGATSTFTGGGSAVALDSGLTVTDTSSTTLSSATVSIGSGFISGDTLNAANPNGLAVSYDAATGVLTLSGTASTGTYQAAIDSVTYSFTPGNGDPTGAGADTTRSISYVVNDGLASSTAATSTLTTTHVAPTVTAGANVNYTGGGNAVPLDSGLTVSDVDSGGTLAGATVSIGTGFISGDQLNFTAQNGISGSYNAATGVLTLSGTSSVANYQAALASITFSDGNNDPTGGGGDTSRSISFVVNDGIANSTAASSTVHTVHVAPTVTAGATATFDGGGSAVALDSTLSISDPDSGGNLTGAAVQIVGFETGDTLNFTNTAHISGSYDASTGVLTLSGTDTVADYQAALRSVSYSFNPANGDPTVGGANTSRSIYWIVTDGNTVNGSNETQPTVQPVNNDQPSLGLNQLVVQQGLFPALGSPLTDSGGIPIGSIRTFAGNFAWGGTSEADGQTLAINSNAALFSLLGANYGGNGTTNFQLPNLEARLAAGGASAGSAFGADDFTLTTSNLPHRWGGSDTAFNNDQPSLTVQYMINTGGSFQAAESTNVIGEVVPFLGATTNAPNGYMFANGQILSIAQYPALFSVLGATYGGNGTTTFALPDLNGRTIIGAGTDGVNSVTLGATTGQDSTSLATANLPAPEGSGQPVNNDQPSLALTYLVALDGIFPSSSGAPAAGQAEVGEIIAYAGTGTALDNMLAAGWAVANGQLLSINQYQAQFAVLGNAYGGNGTATFALPDLVGRSISGTGTNIDGTTVSLGESFGNNNFTLTSNQVPLPVVATSTLDIVHEPPVITAGATANVQSGAVPVTLDSTLSVSDPDSGGHLTGATVSIGSGFVAGDTLGFTNQNNITGSYDAATGVLTLSGTDTLADYQAALEQVSFSATTTTPGSRTIDWVANDGVASSNAATSAVNVVVAPTVTAVVGQPVNGGTIELRGTGAAGQTIDLYADGNTTTIVGTGPVGAGGTFDITTTATFQDGVHTFTATEPQIPAASASSAFSVDVDPSAPAITLLVGQPVNGGAVELQGTGEVGDTIKIFADGGTTVVGTGTVGAGGSFDITTTATYADGVHSFTATETDAANLTSTASTPAFPVNVDPSAPVIAALVGQPVNGGAVELQGTGEVGETVKIYADGGNTVVGTGTVGAGGGFDITTTATYADGVHSFTATETDAANLTSTASSPAFPVNVDPSAPAITALVGQPVNGGPVELKGTGEVGETVKIYADGGTTVVGTGTVGAGGSFDITTAAYADGVHSFTATETDAANLTSTTSSPAFPVHVDPSAPAITALVGQPINGGPVELQGTGEVGETVKIYADGGTTVVGTGTVSAGGSFDITTTAMFADGAHSFTATETDAANLTSTASSPAFSVHVDPTAPVITALVGQPFNGDAVELTGTGEAGETIKLYADNNLATVVGTGTVGVGGTFDITTSVTFAQGGHGFTATETDNANLTSSASTPAFPVTVDPGPVITAVVGQPLNGGTVELQGTGEAGATVNLYVGGNIVGTGTVGVGGTFDITTSIAFADGAVSFTAKETNGVQTSAASQAFSVNVKPSMPLITALVGQPVNGGPVEVRGTGEAGETINLYADGDTSKIVGTGVVGANGTFDIRTKAVFADGVHSFTATQTDLANLTSTTSTPAFSVNVNPSAPLIIAAIGQPINNSSVEVIGFGEVGDTIKLYADGNSATVVGTGTVGPLGIFDITTKVTFSGGLHKFTATATDPANLTSSVATPLFNFDLVVLPPPRTGNPVVVPPPPIVVIAFSEFSLPVVNPSPVATGLGFGESLTPRAEFSVIRSDANVNVADNGAISFDAPLQQLEAALDGDVVSVSATMADGRPLPVWLKFNGQTGQFAGLVPENIATGSIGGDPGNPNRPHDPNVPAQLQQTITIEVVARDSHGNVAITQFTVDLAAQPHRNDKHGWNRLPSDGQDRIIDLAALLPERALRAADQAPWHHAAAVHAERISGGRADAAAPVGRVGLSDQIRSHGWNAVATERLALLESLKQGLAPWR